MATFTSAMALYKHQKAEFERVGASARSMHARIASEGYKDARAMTDGSVGPRGRARGRWLAQNRPFARLGAASKPGKVPGGLKLTPLPIGIISNALYRGWEFRRVRSGALQEFQIRNTAPHAKYILSDAGTANMVGRGFRSAHRKNFKARNKAFLDTIRARRRA